jgi:acid phosphatase family membrane protein YuiD
MDLAYVVAPMFGWLLAGSLKFLINSTRSGRLAFDQVGYGGIPSTHTAIVSTPAFLIGLREGWNTPTFSVAAALILIVVLDATSLRRQIEDHAIRLNLLMQGVPEAASYASLRERLGHKALEVLAGAVVGVFAGIVLYFFSRTGGATPPLYPNP